jgi:TetR/AcrR family transcriptional regulator, transcriptional repressor for nem operon
MGRVSDARERLMQAVLELIWTGSYGTTTIDLICDKAGVKKGSFYHFFESKADLAVAALDEIAKEKRVQLDETFSPTVPPLERFRKYCEQCYHCQCEAKKSHGRVLGCQLFSLGAEVSTQEEKLRKKVQSLLAQWLKYLESAIRDGQAAGVIPLADPVEKAKMLFAYYEGMMTHARIQNDTAVLKDLCRGTFSLLGVKEEALAAA